VERGGSDHSPGTVVLPNAQARWLQTPVWRGIHIGIDERTLQIWAANLTPATWVRRPCCPTSDQIRPIRRSAASTPMEPPTPAKAMTPSRHGAWAVIPPRKTASREKQTPPVRSRATKHCTHCAAVWPHRPATMGAAPPPPRKDRDAVHETAGTTPEREDFARQVAELEVRVAVLKASHAPADPSPTWRHKPVQGGKGTNLKQLAQQSRRGPSSSASVTGGSLAQVFAGRVAAPRPETLISRTDHGNLTTLGCSLVRHMCSPDLRHGA
jgi:hypothetical protein